MDKVLIIGYYKNLGDKLLYYFLTNALKNNYKILKINSKLNLIEILYKVLVSKKIFIYGGIFQDRSSIKSFFYYIFIIRISNLFNKKIYLISTSYEKFKKPLSKYLLNKVKIDFCWARDSFSYKILKKYSKIAILRKDPVEFLLKDNLNEIKTKNFLKVLKINNICFITPNKFSTSFDLSIINNRYLSFTLLLFLNYNFEDNLKTIDIVLNHYFQNKILNNSLKTINENEKNKINNIKISIKFFFTDSKEYQKRKKLNNIYFPKIKKFFTTIGKHRNYIEFVDFNFENIAFYNLDNVFLLNNLKKNIKIFNYNSKIYFRNNNFYSHNDQNSIYLLISSRLHFNLILIKNISNLLKTNFNFYFYGEKNINYFKTHYLS